MYNKRLVCPAVHLELSKRTPFGMDGKKGAPASAGDRQRNRRSKQQLSQPSSRGLPSREKGKRRGQRGGELETAKHGREQPHNNNQ